MGTQGLVVRGNSARSGVGGLHSSGAEHTLTGYGGKEPFPVLLALTCLQFSGNEHWTYNKEVTLMDQESLWTGLEGQFGPIVTHSTSPRCRVCWPCVYALFL